MSWYKWKKIEVICWFCNHLLFVLQLVNSTIRYQYLSSSQVPLVASNRIGKEVIQTEHGDSEITFYGNSFIAGNSFIYIIFIRFSWLVILELAHFLKFLLFPISFFLLQDQLVKLLPLLMTKRKQLLLQSSTWTRSNQKGIAGVFLGTGDRNYTRFFSR